MKKNRIAVLLIGTLLLGAVVVYAQGDLENTYVSNNGALTINYPEEWFAFEEDGIVVVANDEDLLEQEILPPDSAMMYLLLPDLLMTLDLNADVTTAETADMLAELFAEEGISFGESETTTLGEAEFELVVLPMMVEDVGEGIVGAVALEEGILGIWAMVADGEWENVEPLIMAILETASYVEPKLGLPTDNAVEWETDAVSLSAKNFYIVASGKVFTADVDEVEISGDPGDEAYTTLEISWEEHDVPMRLNIYFEADGDNWQAFEIRTYNGWSQGEWIYYEDNYFTSALGEVYEESFSVENGSYGLFFEDLQLQAFTDQTVE